jgi:hypothetical protein
LARGVKRSILLSRGSFHFNLFEVQIVRHACWGDNQIAIFASHANFPLELNFSLFVRAGNCCHLINCGPRSSRIVCSIQLAFQPPTFTMPRSGTNSQGNHYTTPGGSNSNSGSSYHCTYATNLFVHRSCLSISFLTL